MVDALKEVWRTLVPSGVLLDIRPYSAQWPLEVVAERQVWVAGPVDDSPGLFLDQDADDAIGHMGKSGYLELDRRTRFELFYYWDSLDEMKQFVAENWEPYVLLPEDLMVVARRLVEAAGDGARIRVRRTMHIARWIRRAL